MKLLFIVNEPWFFLSHRLPIALAAKKKGYTVHVVTKSGDKVKDISALGFEHHIISLSRSGNNLFSEMMSLFSIWRILIKVKPDIVHLVTIKPVLYGGIAARFAPVDKIVAAVSGLGSLFIAEGRKAKLKRKLGLLLYRFALGSKKTTVIFQNPDDRDMLVDIGAINIKQTILIRGSGVNLSDYNFFNENTISKPVVTFAARLLFDKGLDEYIEAVKLLNAKGIRACYQIVGDIDLGNPTSATKKDLELWSSIPNLKVLGYKKNMAEVLGESNLVVLPSYREGLPKVLIEAAACGRAVITTDVPGCRDAIEENKTGILVPAKDATALADAIELLINDSDLRVKMGTAGRKLAEEAFSIDKVINQHLIIYEES